jgi:hypothetical protein
MAEPLVRVDRNHRTIALSIAINPDWEPDHEQDYPGGVSDEHPQIATASRMLARRLDTEIGGQLTLRQWVIRERGARGGGGRGMARLAADLLGLPTVPRRVPGLARGKQSPEWRRYDAELRKLEEYVQGKYRSAAGARRERIANLGGAEAGNPYRPAPPFADRLERYTITLAARADWRISEDFQPFSLKHHEPESGLVWGPAHEVLKNGGAGLLDSPDANLLDVLIAILTNEIGQTPLIDAADHEGHVYSLHVQARGEG